MRNLQASSDRVIVSEGDEIHSFLKELFVEILGIGDAGRHLESTEQPFGRAETVTGMKMEIDACHGV
jgi:hypothetical protein